MLIAGGLIDSRPLLIPAGVVLLAVCLWAAALRGRLHTIDHLMTPRNNLEIQTKVISRSRAFVGTYGGLSYLAPFYGVTSLAFYSHREKFSPQHLEVSRRVFGSFRRGSYVVLDTQDVDVLGLAFGDTSPLARAVARTEAAIRA